MPAGGFVRGQTVQATYTAGAPGDAVHAAVCVATTGHGAVLRVPCHGSTARPAIAASVARLDTFPATFTLTNHGSLEADFQVGSGQGGGVAGRVERVSAAIAVA